jgi:methionyl-tRNA formyltransferase
MEIAFFSSGSFGLPVLEHLHSRGHHVVVVTKEDAPAGRGLHPRMSPPAELGQSLGLFVRKVKTISDDEFVEWYLQQNFYVAVVVDFGFYIPKRLFSLERPLMVNIHPSLLPRYRGASPIRRALWNGEKITGISLIKVAPKMDEGDIYLQQELPIDPMDDVLTLTKKLQDLSVQLMDEFLTSLEAGTLSPHPQVGEPSYAPKIAPQEEWINWNDPAAVIMNQIRALADVGAKTHLEGKMLKVFKSTTANQFLNLKPGHFKVVKDHLYVGTGDGILELLSMQLEGRKRQDANVFVKGMRLKEGTFDA